MMRELLAGYAVSGSAGRFGASAYSGAFTLSNRGMLEVVTYTVRRREENGVEVMYLEDEEDVKCEVA